MDARVEVLERELAWARCTVHRLATCGVNELAAAIQRYARGAAGRKRARRRGALCRAWSAWRRATRRRRAIGMVVAVAAGRAARLDARQRDAAVSTLQRAWRASSGGRRFAELRRRSAAVAIQRAFRRHARRYPDAIAALRRRLAVLRRRDEDVCPITLERIRRPLRCLVDGRTYEADAIRRWVDRRGTSPVTRAAVGPGELVTVAAHDRLVAAMARSDVVADNNANLYAAAAAGDVGTMTDVLATGLCLIDARHGHDRRTALHAAARNGHQPAVALLLAFGCHVDPLAGGWSPLMNSVWCGPFVEVARELLVNGADPGLRVNGQTALDMAVFRHAVDLTTVLADVLS